MANMVKLTRAFGKGASKPCYINLDNILAMYIDGTCDCTEIVTANQHRSIAVTETPEKIMQLVNSEDTKTEACKEAFIKAQNLWMYYIANGINNTSDKTIQMLLRDLSRVTKLLSDLSGIQNNVLNWFIEDVIETRKDNNES